MLCFGTNLFVRAFALMIKFLFCLFVCPLSCHYKQCMSFIDPNLIQISNHQQRRRRRRRKKDKYRISIDLNFSFFQTNKQTNKKLNHSLHCNEISISQMIIDELSIDASKKKNDTATQFSEH